MVDLNSSGVRALIGAVFNGKALRFKAQAAFMPPLDVPTASGAIEAPLGDYYICRKRVLGYPARCRACWARCSRIAFESRRDTVVANLERYCQTRKAPSNQLKATQIRHRQRYQAAKRGAKGELTTQEWRGVLKAYGGRCAYCGLAATSQDHVVPISQGGSHDISNVVPACTSCNSRKGANQIVEEGQFLLPL